MIKNFDAIYNIIQFKRKSEIPSECFKNGAFQYYQFCMCFEPYPQRVIGHTWHVHAWDLACPRQGPGV